MSENIKNAVVHFNGEEYNVDSSYSADDVREVMSEIDASAENASISLEDKEGVKHYTLTQSGGTKG